MMTPELNVVIGVGIGALLAEIQNLKPELLWKIFKWTSVSVVSLTVLGVIVATFVDWAHGMPPWQ